MSTYHVDTLDGEFEFVGYPMGEYQLDYSRGIVRQTGSKTEHTVPIMSIHPVKDVTGNDTDNSR